MKNKDFGFRTLRNISDEISKFASDNSELLGDKKDILIEISDDIDDWINHANNVEDEYIEIEKERDQLSNVVYQHDEIIESCKIQPDNLYDEQKAEVLERLYNKYSLEQLLQIENDLIPIAK